MKNTHGLYVNRTLGSYEKTPPWYLTLQFFLLYTQDMEKTSAPLRWWDWTSVVLLFLLLQTIASRLVATTWTPFLYLTQTATYMAFAVGTALGYSQFSARLTKWLSFVYMVIMLPLQWTLMIDQNTSLEEQLMSVAGRLYYSTSDFFARRPVDDPIFFVVIMTFTFWFISSWASFTLVRNQNYLGAVIPSAFKITTTFRRVVCGLSLSLPSWRFYYWGDYTSCRTVKPGASDACSFPRITAWSYRAVWRSPQDCSFSYHGRCRPP
jgi:hypothetical protein